VDTLTGCLRRGAFEDRLDDESKLARRDGSTFSVIMADVDNLKSLNDASGHDSGDRALRAMATVLSQVARESDVVGRLGGDEFAMLLHGTDESDAMTAAGRFSEVLHSFQGRDTVTASLGISSWQGAEDGPEAILRRADEALYFAKRSGRDQAALWEPPHAEAARAGRERLGHRPRRRVAPVPT
jgi:diguanylate cyclase (GGDEF)-like protein